MWPRRKARCGSVSYIPTSRQSDLPTSPCRGGPAMWKALWEVLPYTALTELLFWWRREDRHQVSVAMTIAASATPTSPEGCYSSGPVPGLERCPSRSDESFARSGCYYSCSTAVETEGQRDLVACSASHGRCTADSAVSSGRPSTAAGLCLHGVCLARWQGCGTCVGGDVCSLRGLRSSLWKRQVLKRLR